MKNKSVPALVIAAVSTAAAVLAGLFHTFLVMFYYDFDIDYFDSSVSAPMYLYIGCALFGALAGILILLTVKKGTLRTGMPETGKFTTFAAVFSGFMLLVADGFNLINSIRGSFTAPSVLRCVMMVLAIPAAMYYITAAAGHNIDPEQKDYVFRRREISIYLRCAVLVWAIFYLLSRYFTMDQPLQCPLRINALMALVAFLLYTTFEIKNDIGGQEHPRTVLFFGIAAVIALSLYCIQDAVTAFAGIRYSNADTMFSVAGIGIAAYIAGRLFDLISAGTGSSDN